MTKDQLDRLSEKVGAVAMSPHIPPVERGILATILLDLIKLYPQDELAPGGLAAEPKASSGESGTAAASSVDAEFLSLVGHCSNCGCDDCRDFFRGRSEPKSAQCVFRTGCVNGQRCVDAGYCTHGAEMMESMQGVQNRKSNP